MGKSKSELQGDREAYQTLVSQALSAVQEGLYRVAIDLASASWEHIDGMMQYERKFQDADLVAVEGIALVLKYAPMLFDADILEKLEFLLKSQRRIEKHTPGNLGQDLAEARTRMWEAHRLWDHLERNPDCREEDVSEHLGGDRRQWRSLAESWEQMGLVRRFDDSGSRGLMLVTRMDDAVLAKCSSCGIVAKAAKAKFLIECTCPKCRATVFFVFLPGDPLASS